MEPQMHIHTFDTHRLVKAFREEGFKERQAEVLVQSLVESREYDFERLATKDQLSAVEERLTARIDNKINQSTNYVIKWMVGLFVTIILAMVGMGIPIVMKVF